jgi:hypothetical protein
MKFVIAICDERQRIAVRMCRSRDGSATFRAHGRHARALLTILTMRTHSKTGGGYEISQLHVLRTAPHAGLRETASTCPAGFHTVLCGRLRCRQPRRKDPERRTRHIVQPEGVTELDRTRLASMLTTDPDLQFWVLASP